MLISESDPKPNGSFFALRGVEAGYGESLILHGVTLEVPHNGIMTLIGANGAGKSTVLKTAFGILRPVRGHIVFDGRDVTATSSIARLRLGIAYCPQGRCNFPNMTVRENLEMGAYQRRDHEGVARTIAELLDLFPLLRDREREYVGNLSGGQQQVVEMAMSLVMKPKLLLIDEPSIGLSPVMVEDVFEHIRTINRAGVTILMVEQNARRALASSDIGVVLELGRVLLEQPADEMLNNEDVRRHYLGGTRVRNRRQ
ncbi:MAG TPA: ABC transporter ATP-binding protein [bacterium]|nr:ABC transporter ATP-binding protein [bacterium]